MERRPQKESVLHQRSNQAIAYRQGSATGAQLSAITRSHAIIIFIDASTSFRIFEYLLYANARTAKCNISLPIGGNNLKMVQQHLTTASIVRNTSWCSNCGSLTKVLRRGNAAMADHIWGDRSWCSWRNELPADRKVDAALYH